MITGLFYVLCVLLPAHPEPSATVPGAQAIPASSVAVVPQKIEFTSQTVHTSSPPAVATLTNVSTSNVEVRDISAAGIDFTETNDCPASLPPGANCKIAVTFTPAITGPRIGTIIISASEQAKPLFLVVSGTGE